MIPGIIKSYEYAMIPYILAERSDLNTQEAFDLSKRMMDGEKFDAFILDLSFIGWMFAVLFSFGLAAVFYVDPYIHMTGAELYEVLKGKIGWHSHAQQDRGMGYYGGNGKDLSVMGEINYPEQHIDTYQ